jgi:hypothetical protein
MSSVRRSMVLSTTSTILYFIERDLSYLIAEEVKNAELELTYQARPGERQPSVLPAAPGSAVMQYAVGDIGVRAPSCCH